MAELTKVYRMRSHKVWPGTGENAGDVILTVKAASGDTFDVVMPRAKAIAVHVDIDHTIRTGKQHK